MSDSEITETQRASLLCTRGGSRISEKGVHIIKVYVSACVEGGGGGGGGVRFADLISFFLKYPMKMRPNYFIFRGYSKTGGGEGVRSSIIGL